GRRTRMRDLRLQDEGARRRPPATLHRRSPALRASVPGAAAASPGLPHRNRPRLPLGPRARARERLPRAVRIPLRALPDRRRRRARARVEAALRRRRLAQLTRGRTVASPGFHLVRLDTARPRALVHPLHRAARET